MIVTLLILGFLAGITFSGITMSISSGEMMVKEYRSPYDFDKTVSLIAERINTKEGWHVTEVIDQNQESIEHGGTPIGHYKIIKYCSGRYSSKMLQTDDRKKIGSMLPKTFAVYEKSDGRVFVSTMNGAVMGKIFGGETEKIIEQVSLEVEDMMRFLNLKYSLF
jgi:uncharacterized protein (DUF302 family)